MFKVFVSTVPSFALENMFGSLLSETIVGTHLDVNFRERTEPPRGARRLRQREAAVRGEPHGLRGRGGRCGPASRGRRGR